MKITETKIYLNSIRIYAYHGVEKQENIVGNAYILNIELAGDFSKAALEDSLQDTVNYAEVFELARREMAVQSELIENAAYRIAVSVLENFDNVSSVSVGLEKENPPMGANIASAGVKISVSR